ncbi:glycosyltransferase family 8 protein [Postia placenta MAD-698-R-SB12]|uniref:Glycosyltransferase family 8 protein n=1 Tax=Postia placenta MAD-698-R-SB12 TaxID=670580 RepID=A0A1X6MZI2_9APHY|nr:glycosyltransferase family 8 protein [Postia placenta MAD-698-R-SB12]OSX61765.1 glycosyltransferase family 8 protein [Postia placenta MAD-698-R-SB12]
MWEVAQRIRGRLAGWLRNPHQDYTPLWSDASNSRPLSRKYVLLALVLIGASALTNVILYGKLAKRWPGPLDNYQPLTIQPVVNDDFLRTRSPPLNSSENAIVTSLYTDSYATAIATLGHSLNRANSTASRILFYLPEKISPRALCIATATGFIPRAITRIPPPHGGKGVYDHFMDQYSKLNIWTLADEGYKGVVYLDADTLVLRNFDELFALPYNFAAVPDVYVDGMGFSLGFNAGVLFLRPSTEVFTDMLAKIDTASYNMHEAEQSFLNHYYGAEAVRLPYAYNANLAIKKRKPELWADVKREARIVHYTLVKPFLKEWDNSGKTVVEIRRMESNVQNKLSAFGGMFKEELLDWVGIWKETRRTYADVLTVCSGASATLPSS